MLKLLKSEYFNQIGRFDSVDMMWIKGHVDVYGNNIVDNIAKKMLRSANKNNGGIYTVKYQKGSPLQKLNKLN